MGNVAHDLKTPLHSIVADLSALKSRMIDLSSSSSFSITPTSQRSSIGAIEILTAGTAGSSGGDNSGRGGLTTAIVTTTPMDLDQDNPVTLITSIESATQFMQMAINRSQDYMKSSCNMALLPSLSSFEIGNAVQIAYTCVNNLHSGRFINILPISANFCTYVISDRHWLIENLMCLISNAVKYSDKGTTVTVTVKLLLNDELSASNTDAAVSSSTLGPFVDKDVSIQLVKKLKSVQQDDAPIGYRGILKTSGESEEKKLNFVGDMRNDQVADSGGIRGIDGSSHHQSDLIQGSSVMDKDNGSSRSDSSGKMVLAFYVEDNGIGISEEVMTSICCWDPYSTF